MKVTAFHNYVGRIIVQQTNIQLHYSSLLNIFIYIFYCNVFTKYNKDRLSTDIRHVRIALGLHNLFTFFN